MARLVLRADGGRGIGAGHLGRCLALAQAWRDAGGDATLVSQNPPARWAERYRREGVSVEVPNRNWEAQSADWIVLDGYSFGLHDQERVKAAGRRLAVVDDHGAAGQYLADIIIDQNLGTSADFYDERPFGSALLLGPAFALLRREFRDGPVVVRDVADRVLVLLGGSPPRDAEMRVDQALGLLEGVTVVRPSDTDRVAEAMTEADLAVAGAGITTWELCAMGLPAALIVLAENQAPVAAAVDEAGAAVNLGEWRDVTTEHLASAVAGLLSSPDRRRLLATVGRTLVDGRGARRVVARLRAPLLNLRYATADDARILWEWANDESVRRLSFSPAPIPWTDHVAWVERTIADPAVHLYVARDERGQSVGQIRFDAANGQADVDVSVAPAARGQGVGAAIICAGVDMLFARSAVHRVVARIRPENRPSVESFSVAGFGRESEQSDGTYRWLLYARHRDDAA